MADSKKVLLALASYDQEMHRGFLDYAREKGWNVQVVSPSTGGVYQYWDGDGIICCLSTNRQNHMTEFVLNHKAPKVELSKSFPDEAMAQVYEDNEAIGKMAAEHFLTRGFQRALYLTHYDFWHVNERGESFVRHMEAGGVETPFIHLCHALQAEDSLIEWIAGYLKKQTFPLAVFTGFDNEAQYVIEACKLAGIRIPEEVSVLGTANHEILCDWAEIPISSVDTSRRLWAHTAATVLDEMMAGKASAETVKLIPPSRVVERKSTSIYAVEDVTVQEALKFIAENIHAPLNLEAVADAIGISRSSLSRKFRQVMNCSVGDEIKSLKIIEAKRLLLEGKNTVETAKALGFSTPYYFYRVFKQMTGMTANDFLASYQIDD